MPNLRGQPAPGPRRRTTARRPTGLRYLLMAIVICPLLAAGLLAGFAQVSSFQDGIVVQGQSTRAWVEQLGAANPADQVAAQDVLESVGAAAAPQLGEGLFHPQVTVRRKSASLLRKLGPAAAPALDDLASALRDSDAAVRLQAAETLRGLGAEAADAVAPLAAALRDEDPRVRLVAAHALGSIGPQAMVAHPALMDAMQDQRVYVRRAASSAIAKIFAERNDN